MNIIDSNNEKNDNNDDKNDDKNNDGDDDLQFQASRLLTVTNFSLI